MGKSPAVQIYASDFFTDTIGWDPYALGIYWRLLMYEWINGGIPKDFDSLCRISGAEKKRLVRFWSRNLKYKFRFDNTKKHYVNNRLEEVRRAQEEFKKRQSESGLRGIEKKREKGIYPFKKRSDPSSDPSSDPATRNQALLSSSLKDKDKDINTLNSSQRFDLNGIEVRLSKLLFERIRARDSKAKPPNLNQWARHIDLLLRVDRRTPEDIEWIINWCQDDDFWRANILSTAALRKRFTQLVLKADSGNSNKHRGKSIESSALWLDIQEAQDGAERQKAIPGGHGENEGGTSGA